jgi:hypothetical protein
MDATPGYFAAPGECSPCGILQIDESFAFEETFPGETDMVLHGGFVFGMVGSRRIGEESPEGCIFQEHAVQARNIWIRQVQTRLHPVDNNPSRAAAKEAEGFFKAVDDGLEILTEYRDDARQAAIAEHHDEAMHRSRPIAGKILEIAETAKVDFGELPRLGVELADDDRCSLAKVTLLMGKAMQ